MLEEYKSSLTQQQVLTEVENTQLVKQDKLLKEQQTKEIGDTILPKVNSLNTETAYKKLLGQAAVADAQAKLANIEVMRAEIPLKAMQAYAAKMQAYAAKSDAEYKYLHANYEYASLEVTADIERLRAAMEIERTTIMTTGQVVSSTN